MNKHRMFLSYSHEDSSWLEKVKKFLRPLERRAEIVLWSDTNIQASSRWHADIQTAINEADAAVLLISQNFLASEYVASDELPQLLNAANQRGLRVFPVILSSCYLRGSPLLTFQAINSPSAPLDSLSDAEQNRLLTKLVESIDDVLKLSSSGVTEEWLEKFRARFVPVQGGTYASGDNELNAKLHGLPLPLKQRKRLYAEIPKRSKARVSSKFSTNSLPTISSITHRSRTQLRTKRVCEGAAFPDFRAEIHWQLADGGRITTYKTYYGTHRHA